MKKKKIIPSKIPTTQTNTNRKKVSDTEQVKSPIAASLFKKNEFALIVFGALLLTLIVFFVFFQRPDKAEHNTPASQSAQNKEIEPQSASFNDIEKRIEQLEKGMSISGDAEQNINLTSLQDRVNRLETAFDVKFDSLADRMGSIEKQLTALNQKIANTGAAKQTTSTSSVSKKAQTESKSSVKTTSKTVSKAPMFHTVKKGETLYSIGRKYNISVPALQKLNKLTSESKIYPGMNILIR
jgi:hypothetical protein